MNPNLSSLEYPTFIYFAIQLFEQCGVICNNMCRIIREYGWAKMNCNPKWKWIENELKMNWKWIAIVLNINVLINPVLLEGLVSELLVDACISFNKYDRIMVVQELRDSVSILCKSVNLNVENLREFDLINK